jgi:hypothetical protein
MVSLTPSPLTVTPCGSATQRTKGFTERLRALSPRSARRHQSQRPSATRTCASTRAGGGCGRTGNELHFVSDRDGWWGLYSWEEGRVSPVLIGVAELGVAQWEFGYPTYTFLSYGHIAVISQNETRQSLKILDQQRAQVRTVQLPHTSIKPYLPASGNGADLGCKRTIPISGRAFPRCRQDRALLADLGGGR